MTPEHVDVLIVGAGISGVGAGCRLQEKCPDKTFAILEARGAIGGTWDLFRFPGIRSDSDMFTLCYPFRPWSGSQAIVDGSSILEYIRQTAREHGIDQRIRFHHRVVAAEWSSADARWTVEVERGDTGETVQLSCGFLFTCTGYYRYDEGYTPEFQGIERFGGEIVHPQFWTDDIDYTRQARGRDRQRRDRGDGHPGAGAARRPRNDAAALAQLHHLAARGRSDRRPTRACAADTARLSGRALEEHHGRTRDLRSQPPPARGDESG